MSRLEEILEDMQRTPRKLRPKAMIAPVRTSFTEETNALNPWRSSSAVATALGSFVSRVEDVEIRQKLEELCKETQTLLGVQAVGVASGVFNAVTLYRILLVNETEVSFERSERRSVTLQSAREVETHREHRFHAPVDVLLPLHA